MNIGSDMITALLDGRDLHMFEREMIANELRRLRAERDEARSRERGWHDASVQDRTELHALKNA